MHDIDRTQHELEYGFLNEYQSEDFEFGDHEESYQFEDHEGIYEFGDHEGIYEFESVLNEVDEMELAAELLEITSEAELDQFLGKLIGQVGHSLGKVVSSPVGRAIGSAIKPLAKAALPVAGKIVGGVFGGPLGAQIGGKLGTFAGNLFGLELEGLSAEDREFEVAKRFVRLGATATRNALKAPPRGNPTVNARRALLAAIRRLAPGLRHARQFNGQRAQCNCPVQGAAAEPSATPMAPPQPQTPAMPAAPDSASEPDAKSGGSEEFEFYEMEYERAGASGMPAGGGQRGTWVRRGRRIILYGV
jgi:uncharacterized protein (DUF697 family)